MSRILIVDDEQNWLKTYKRIFRTKDYETAFASSGAEAMEKAVIFKPDIILLDIMMPGISGYQVCEDLKSRDDLKETEIIFVSGQGKLDDRLKAYRLRASDFLVKPFSHDELLAKIELLLEKRKLYLEMASTDPLTKLGNRKFFDEKFENILQISSKYDKTFSISIADIDHFKKVNDTYGHDMGDFILIQVATRLNNVLRKSDIVARIGGEEFAILLPEIAHQNVDMVLNRCRGDIEHYDFKKSDSEHTIRVTISMGFSSFPHDATNKKELFKKADQALYMAKNGGRNQVRAFS